MITCDSCQFLYKKLLIVMDPSETDKGKEKDTDWVGAPPLIDDGEFTTSAAGSPKTNTFISMDPSINPKQAKKWEELTKLGLAEDESDNEITEAAVPARPSTALPAPKAADHTKKQKSHAPRPSFDKPEQLPLDFPDENAKLTEDQIRKLICQGPALRKRYHQHFVSSGHLRSAHYNLICEKLPTGELKYEQHVLSSNLGPRWGSVLQRFQQREQRDVPTKPPRKRKTKASKESKSVEDGTEPKENHDGAEATLKNSTPHKGAARLSTPTSEGLFGPLSETTTAADNGEGPSKRPSRETIPPLIPSYRSRSPLGPARPSGNRLAGLPAPQDDPFVHPDRRRSRSPRGSSATRGEDEPQLYAQQIYSTRQYFEDAIMRANRICEGSDLDQMTMDDLAAFVQLVQRGIAKLNTTLLIGSDNSKSLELKLKVIDLMVKSLSLQLSCFKLRDQLKADTMAE